MELFDIGTVCEIIYNTCDKNGFQYWEVVDCQFIVWSRAKHHTEVVSVRVDELGYVEISNRSKSESFEFENLDYPYDPDIGMTIYRLLD